MSQVDFYSALSGLGDTIAANRNAAAKRDAFAQATTPGPDGQIDFQKAILGLAQVDPQAASVLAQRQNHEDMVKRQAASDARQAERDRVSDRQWAATHSLATRRLDSREPNELERRAVAGGLKPGTPQYQDFMLRGGRNADVAPSAGEKKEIWKSENEIPALDSTIANVERALKLNPDVYSGYGASTRGAIGAKLPDGMVPDFIASPKGGKATAEWDQLMGQEAIKMMSETLKGASTDFEMRKFLGIAADTAQPEDVRKNAMERFLNLAKQERAIRVRRVKELSDGTYFKQKPPESTPTAPTTQIPPAAIEALKKDPRRASDFDAKYGAGSARSVLMGGQ